MIGHLFLVDFITNPRLRKRAFLILRFESLVTCKEGVRHLTMLVQGQSFVLIKP